MMNKNLNCIILAAGKGSRMQSKDTHKVCFDINGKPAIIQAIDRYCSAGVKEYTIVVGTMAEQVMQTVSSVYPNVKYAYQAKALGTGHAARVGYECSSADNIMITMGDKLVSPETASKLISEFESNDLDLMFAVVPVEYNPSGGKIVVDEGVKGILEDVDIKKAQIYLELLNKLNEGIPFNLDTYIKEISANVITSERKRNKVLDQMSDLFDLIRANELQTAKSLLEKGARLELGDVSYTPSEVLSSSLYVNAAVYLFKSSAFEYGLEKISSDNAQGEEYLTDVINAVCCNPDYKVDILKVDNQEDILTYNNVSELIKIQEILSTSKKEYMIHLNKYKFVEEWLILFREKNEQLLNTLVDIYGENSELIDDRISAYISVLEKFRKSYGSKKVVISRAPGRVNLMGRHVEHRGGCVNVISINKEMICVGAPNEEGNVNITNTDSGFDDKSFNISDHFKDVTWEDWLDYLDNDRIIKLVNDSRGDWINYVKAPILKLQHDFKDQQLSGMDLAFTGDIPVSAGLSSSSAVVVSTAEVTVTINNFDVKPHDFVDLCGKGEWFVGSRGGAGDHAAMKFGERGYITSLGFFPFGYRESFPFPEGYQLIIADSYVKANKTTNAKDSFNQRIASYEFGFMMLKDRYKQYADKLHYLRDINPENLEVKQSKIYEMILSLPDKIRPDDVYSLISKEYHPDIKRILKTHNQPDVYYIRSVIMYGVAECRRSFMCSQLLKDRDFKKFGWMMKISHNGDRVFDTANNCEYDWSISDEEIHSLINLLRSEDFYKVNDAQLHNQPGGYACSTKEIDYIVDTVNQIDGVIGAQLAGAGLGGCVMILVKEDSVNEVIKVLNEKYYVPNNLEDGITICIPVKGSGVIEC